MLDIDIDQVPERIEELRAKRITAKDAYDNVTREIRQRKAEYKVEARSEDTDPSNRDERKNFVKQKEQSGVHKQLVGEQEDLRREIETTEARIERLRKEFALATGDFELA
jgi:uncharacterized protein YoaH (UPF0181 family)